MVYNQIWLNLCKDNHHFLLPKFGLHFVFFLFFNMHVMESSDFLFFLVGEVLAIGY
jgi:hypothetical protein